MKFKSGLTPPLTSEASGFRTRMSISNSQVQAPILTELQLKLTLI